MTDPRRNRDAPAPAPDGVWLGLDLGTQSARCMAVDGTGQVLATAARPLTGRRDGNRHEQDPEEWWSALAAACREALGQIDTRRVRGLAVDGTSGTILLADAHGTPLTPGVMYDDGRAAAQAAAVNAAGETVWRELGYRSMQPSWALPTLVRLLEDAPARRAGVRLLHQVDLVTWRLAGRQVAADASHALKTGYHLVEERWPHRVMAELGVPEGVLPEVVRPGGVLGSVCAAAAEATGIPAGTTIVAGMTDGCAAQIGAGALAPGAWNSVLGTTLVLKGSSPHLVRDPAGVVYCHRGPGDNWLPGGASSSGAGVLSRHFGGEDLDALTAQAAALHDPDAVAYPLVAGGGERFPFRAPDAQPFVLGHVPTRAAEFHAYLLGVACLERLCFDYLDHLGAPVDGPLTLTGGGARNAYWCQLRADVLGRPVRLPQQAEAALGMAVLAATAGGAGLQEAAAAMVRTDRELTPAPARTAHYAPVHLRFIDALTRRGWLDPAVADHARRRAAP
ncbi:FGGY family carbohydrate kinase [Streptomyces sp. DSM 41527]|uniref:FGGY family carbohydrate kinase n=1 Tax=Streptomyces mooreae TaxID=3075523 RepID=A0ABU2TEJ8_9ACTN|nr:FGGY family carbohydrate kinase [Streptomyces sp. DSM 41527]MDT0459331.1 FGGY family carbohydrate kinase [Streptomyces sp. DSM 41527]